MTKINIFMILVLFLVMLLIMNGCTNAVISTIG